MLSVEVPASTTRRGGFNAVKSSEEEPRREGAELPRRAGKELQRTEAKELPRRMLSEDEGELVDLTEAAQPDEKELTGIARDEAEPGAGRRGSPKQEKTDNVGGEAEENKTPAEPAVQISCSSSTRGIEELSLDEEVPWENRVREAADRDGETLVTAGPMPAAEVEGTLERIAQVAAMVNCDSSLVHVQDHPLPKNASKEPNKADAVPTRTAFVLVRKQPSEAHHLDLRVAVVGNVDAGKSTLVGVLTGPTTFLDDGRGLARSRVLRHKHEAETGRTSSIAEDQHMRLDTKGSSLATERHQKTNPGADAAQTAKVVSFIDLAGHEKYLRTTVYGLTAHEPDYGAHAARPRTCSTHMQHAHAARIHTTIAARTTLLLMRC